MHTAATRGDTNVASAVTPAQYRTPTLCPEHLTPLTPLTNSGVHRVSILLMLGIRSGLLQRWDSQSRCGFSLYAFYYILIGYRWALLFSIPTLDLGDQSNLVALGWDDGVSSSESIWRAAQFFTCCRGGFGSMSHIYLAQQLFA